MRELTPLEKAIVFLDSAEGIEYKYKKFVIENFKGDFFGDEKKLTSTNAWLRLLSERTTL